MKKLFYFVAMFVAFAACDEKSEDPAPGGHKIWDFVNYSVEIKVLNQDDGSDLLDPTVEGNLLGSDVILNYKGRSYPISPATESSRANRALFSGLVWTESLDNSGYRLTVGQFQTGNVHNEPFTIDWGDGSQTRFVVTALVQGSNDAPEVVRSLTVDGVEIACKTGENWQVELRRAPVLASDDNSQNTEEPDDPAIDTPIYDFTNYSIAVSVVNADGLDLLNPDTPGNLLDRPICAYYQGETYPRWTVESLTAYYPEELTRAFMPLPLALRWGREFVVSESGPVWTAPYYVAFGEFSPEQNYRNEPFTIDWGDGSQTEFVFDCHITYDEEQMPNVHRELRVDGEPVAHDEGRNWYVTIIR